MHLCLICTRKVQTHASVPYPYPYPFLRSRFCSPADLQLYQLHSGRDASVAPLPLGGIVQMPSRPPSRDMALCSRTGSSASGCSRCPICPASLTGRCRPGIESRPFLVGGRQQGRARSSPSCSRRHLKDPAPSCRRSPFRLLLLISRSIDYDRRLAQPTSAGASSPADFLRHAPPRPFALTFIASRQPEKRSSPRLRLAQTATRVTSLARARPLLVHFSPLHLLPSSSLAPTRASSISFPRRAGRRRRKGRQGRHLEPEVRRPKGSLNPRRSAGGWQRTSSVYYSRRRLRRKGADLLFLAPAHGRKMAEAE